MNMSVLLSQLRQEGIRVQARGDKLDIKSTVSPIPEDAIRRLKTHKSALLRYLQGINNAETEITAIGTAQKKNGVALSAQQMSLWPLYRMGKSAQYNIPIYYDISGELHVDRLTNALKQVYERYDALQARFTEQNGEVRVQSALCPDWQVEVQAVSEQDDVALAYEQEQQRVFDLTRDSLFIARLFLLAEKRAVLILNFPHIIIDGWSIEQIWQDIALLYQGQEITPSAVDYFDYLAWEKTRESHADYWKARLSDYEAFQLHNVTAPDPQASHLYYSRMSDTDRQALQKLADRYQVSVFSAALYLWGKTLATYTGQNDVVIATPYANREHNQTQSLIGYFVAMLPVRFRADTFVNNTHDDLTEFSRLVNSDFAAAHTDFNQLLPELGLQTHAGRHPLQQVVFAWQEGVASLPELAGLEIERKNTELVSAKFPLSFSVIPVRESYQLKWEFDPAVMSRRSVECLETLWLSFLRQSDSDKAHGTLFSDPVVRADYDSPGNLVDLFQACARQNAFRTAIRYGSTSISYSQLYESGLHIAAKLQEKGITPGDRVGLLIPRCEQLAFAVLGIVLAGGVYVPLSAGDSAERNQELIRQCQITVCLTVDTQFFPQHAQYQATCSALSSVGTVALVMVPELLLESSQSYQPVELTGESPVYINFSSGTTGEPKGIECLHQGVVRLVHKQNYMTLDARTHMLSAAPATFDAFTLEFWGPLLNGGQVSLLTDSHLTCEHLRTLIQHEQVNSVWLTAALFHTLVDIDPSAFSGLTQLLVGGDVVSPVHVKRLYGVNDTVQIINGYGPTENTTFTCCFPIPRDWPVTEALPVGVPVNGSEVFIVNAQMLCVPNGCVGEIVTTGCGLASGYLRPEQQKDRFVHLGHSQRHLAGKTADTAAALAAEPLRAYRTGDLGFIDHSGAIHFMGRRDQQLKINGYRIELDAVNRALNHLPDVLYGETLALGAAGKKQLVSFVQLDNTLSEGRYAEHVDQSDIVNALSRHLPGYMLPVTVIFIEQLPVTLHGKVDRKKLADIYKEYSHESVLAERALTDTEQCVAEAWDRVLGCGRCSPSSHFYRLGGNSLQLLKVQRELEQVLKQPIDFDCLIRNETLAGMAHAVSLLSQKQAGAPVDTVDVSAISVDSISADSIPFDNIPSDNIPVTHEQLRLWTIQQRTPDSSYNIPILMRFSAAQSAEQILTALEKLFRAHPVLRMRFVESGEGLVQTPVAVSALLPQVHTVDESTLQEKFHAESVRVFALDKQVVACSLWVLPDNTKALIWNIHHICFDGESLAVFIRQFELLLQGQEIALSQGFEAYACWQRSRAYAEKADAAQRFWLKSLSGLEESTVLPGDIVSQSAQPSSAASISTPASTSISKTARLECSVLSQYQSRIDDCCQHLGVSAHSYWLALFSFIVGRLTDRKDVAFLVPVANRAHSEYQQAIGFFANTIVLRQQWHEQETFHDLVIRTFRQTRERLAHQSVPFERVLQQHLSHRQQDGDFSDILFSVISGEYQPAGNEFFTLETGKNAAPKYGVVITVNLLNQSQPTLTFEYDNTRYSDVLMTSMIETVWHVLTQLQNDQKTPLNHIVLSAPAPIAYCQRPGPFVAIHQVIRQRAVECSRQPALQDDAQQLSYQALISRAEGIAAFFQQQGIGKGQRVAVLMERTIDLPVTLLGVLLSGAAYVPLDPAYPSERTQYILADSKADLLVYSHCDVIQALAPACPQVQITDCLAAAEPDLYQPVDITGHDLAYLIYTSGSTGQPKGVAIRHEGVFALYHWSQNTYTSADFACVYGGTSVCFDLSVFELFVTWAIGGCLVFANNTLSLADDFSRFPVTLVNTVPSVLSQVLESQAIPEQVRVINLAGEPLPASLARMILRQSSRVALFNLYGPSEDTTYSTAYRITEAALEKILIGQPVAGTGALVADAEGRPMPVGFPGELYLSGAGLAQGYWNRDSLTREKFVENSFIGERCYKTGDIVRCDAQHRLEYLGREDDQVKIRGFRIELGEIETVMTSLSGVMECCVIPQKQGGTWQLLAYVRRENMRSIEAELIAELKTRLPAYMVPGRVVFIDEIPLTPSGKADRKKLSELQIPALSARRPDSTLAAEAHTETGFEHTVSQLLQIIEQLTGVRLSDQQVSIFDVGVSSLLALKLKQVIAKTFAVELKVSDLFSAPSIRGIAALIHADHKSAESTETGMDAFFAAAVRRHRIPKAQLALATPSMEAVYHTGFAGSSTGVNPHDMGFRVSCNMKLLSLILVCRMAEQGLIDLDESVTHYLADLESVRLLQDVTLAQLISHTHGLEFNLLPSTLRESTAFIQWLQHDLHSLRRVYTPGCMFNYSMLAPVLVMCVLEQVGGKSYMGLLQDYVLKPLGITVEIADDRIVTDNVSAPVVREGYQLVGDHLDTIKTPAHHPLMIASGSLGVYLSARDLMAVGRSYLLSDKGGTGLLSDSMITAVYQRKTPVENHPFLAAVGLGLFQMTEGYWGHTGDGLGQHSCLQIDPQRGRVLVCQTALYPAHGLFQELYSRFHTADSVSEKNDRCVEEKTLSSAADFESFSVNPIGTYINSYLKVIVSIENDSLQFQVKEREGQLLPDTEKFVLKPIVSLAFTYLPDNAQAWMKGPVTFFNNNEGEFMRIGLILLNKN